MSGNEWIIQSPGDTSEFEVVSYFTGGAPVTLAVEESMVFRFDFSAEDVSSDTIASTGFRLGLFNSGGFRLSGDIGSVESPVFSDYGGYGAMLTLKDSTAGSVRIIRRTTSNNNLLGRGAAYTTLSDVTSPVMAADTVYKVVFRVSRLNEDSVQVSVSLNGSVVGGATAGGDKVVDYVKRG